MEYRALGRVSGISTPETCLGTHGPVPKRTLRLGEYALDEADVKGEDAQGDAFEFGGV